MGEVKVRDYLQLIGPMQWGVAGTLQQHWLIHHTLYVFAFSSRQCGRFFTGSPGDGESPTLAKCPVQWSRVAIQQCSVMLPLAHAASPIRGQDKGSRAEHWCRQMMSLFGDRHRAKPRVMQLFFFFSNSPVRISFDISRIWSGGIWKFPNWDNAIHVHIAKKIADVFLV